jgi:hypothetical protein
MAMRIGKLALYALLSTSLICGASNIARGPSSFEPGAGDSEFVSHFGAVSIALTSAGAVIGSGSMRLVGARRNASAQPEELLLGYSNYLIDSDPRKWRTHLPNYRRVRYRHVYPGIDIVYYGNPGELEFDFIVEPGADPRRIRLALSSPHLQIRLPRIYQGDQAIKGRAVRRGKYVTIEMAAYDHSRPLVIDPVLSYSAIFGGGGSDQGHAIAVDSTGAAYIVGDAFDGNFPLSNGQSGRYSFLAKLSAAGDALVYSTYLPWFGGGQASYAVDASGAAYLTRDGGPFPGFALIGPPPLRDCGISPPSIYVAKLSPDGASLVYSGCVGGTAPNYPTAIAADATGNAYVTGFTQSGNFPLLNPIQSTHPAGNGFMEGFVLKLRPDGEMVYSTFLGGGADFPRAIATDAAGNAYITGWTRSPNFPLKNAIQSQPKGPAGASTPFVAKINADGSNLVYSTYIGGSNYDLAMAIAADALGNTYVAGTTTSADFPTTANAFQAKFNGVFAVKSTDGAASWSRSDSGLLGTASFIQVDPNNTSLVYAVSSSGLYKSVDHGATWHATSASSVTSLWISPADSTLYLGIAGKGDLLRSRDSGASFTTMSTGRSGSINEMVFDPHNASVIYGRWGGSGPGDGVFKSTDGGSTWNSTGLTGSATGSGPLAIDPAHPSTLYAEARNRGLVVSTDGGDTWTLIGGDVSDLSVDSKSTLYAVSDGAIYVLPAGGVTVQKVAPASVGALVVDPTNNSTWYATTYSSSGNGFYKTTDRGDHWQPVNNGLPNLPSITSVAIDPNSPGTLYLGMVTQTHGFFAELSPDGTSLKYSTYLGGTGSEMVNAIAVDAPGSTYVAGTTTSTDFPLQSAFRTDGSGFLIKIDTSGALAWSSRIGEATPRAIALAPAGDVYLTGGSASAAVATPGAVQQFVSGDFFQTTDGGATWTGSIIAPSIPSVLTVAVDPKTPSRLFALADPGHLYGSSDSGQSWTPLGSPGLCTFPCPTLVGPFGPAYTLILDPLNPTTMYGAGSCFIPGTLNGCGISKSTDGGVTWSVKPITAAGQPTNNIVLGLAIDPKTTSTIYAATAYQGIYKSTDAGATWNISGSLTSTVAVAVDPLNTATIYASVGNGLPPALPPPGSPAPFPALGLYKSVDAGGTWTAINTGLPSGWFASILIADPGVEGRVYAWNYLASGLYRSDNGGNNWAQIGSGLPDWPINAMAIDPTNSSMLYAASSAGGLYRSPDAGATWHVMPGLRVPIVNSITVDPSDPTHIFAGTQLNPQDVFVIKISQ